MDGSALQVEFKDILNLKALIQFQRIFYKLTGLPVSICNPDLKAVTFYPGACRSQFCRLIQTSPEGLERCRTSDRNAVKTAIRKNRPHIYRCHAGLVNVAIPLVVEGTHVGSIFTGQVLTEPLGPEAMEAFRINLKGLPLKTGALEMGIRDLDVVSEARLRTAAQLLFLLATYIVDVEALALARSRAAEGAGGDGGLGIPEGLEERLKRSEPFGSMATSGVEGTGFRKEVVRLAERFVYQNLGEKLTLANVAGAVGLSPTYFARMFKDETGLTFHSYVVQVRMQRAAELLKDHSLTIGEIAYIVGYPDQNYFSQVFKKVMGMSPTDYRK